MREVLEVDEASCMVSGCCGTVVKLDFDLPVEVVEDEFVGGEEGEDPGGEEIDDLPNTLRGR